MSVARAITQTAYWLRRLSLLSLAAFAGVAAASLWVAGQRAGHEAPPAPVACRWSKAPAIR